MYCKILYFYDTYIYITTVYRILKNIYTLYIYILYTTIMYICSSKYKWYNDVVSFGVMILVKGSLSNTH